MAWSRGLLASVLALSSLLAACGRAPGGASASGLDGVQALATTALPIAVHFTEAYHPTVAVNEPLARKSPTNPDKPLLHLIQAAKATLDGAFYDLEDLGVAKAFVAAKARGVRVRIVTETDNLVDKVDPAKPRPAIAMILAAGIPVVDDKRSGFMHHKFLVADGLGLWTGSTNLTTSSLYRNNNNALVLRSPQVAKAFSGEFERLFTKHQFSQASRVGVAQVPPIRLGSATLRLFFSPGGGGRAAVVKALAASRQSLRFLTFSLTEPEIGNTILARAAAGVKVEGVFDRWLAAGKYSLFNPFAAAKLAVVKDGNEALMHHKAMLIDGKCLITGSYNYSQNAEQNNNEAFMILEGAPSLAKAFDQEFDRVRRVAYRAPSLLEGPMGTEGSLATLADEPYAGSEGPAEDLP